MRKTQPEPTSLRLGAEWPRFSAYELRDGCIRPTENARLERYDPLTERSERGKRPYEDLAELIRQGRYTVSSRAVTPKIEASVVSWCQQYGLLGVLLQRVDTVVLPVQTTRSRSKKERSVSQAWCHRTREGWNKSSEGLIGTTSLPHTREVGVMLHGLNDSDIAWEPLSQTWGTFFPSVPAKQRHTFQYPHPHDAAFWRIYEEPLDVFLDAAARVSWLLATIVGGPDTISQNRVTSDPRADYALAISDLIACANAQLSPTPSTTARFSLHLVAPTLFGSLALTALQDLAGQAEFRTCEKCGRLFVSRAYQTRYCSTRCRATINKRTYRKKHPADSAAG